MLRINFMQVTAFALCQSFCALSLAQTEVRDPATFTDANQTQPDTSAPRASAPSSLTAAPPEMTTTTTTIPAAQDAQVDVIKHTWPNRPMLITGIIVLGGTYGASAIVGAASNRTADDKLFLPVVGPWLDLKNRDCERNACGSDTFNKVLLVGDGALQGIGALSVLLSLVIPESTKKPWYLVGDEKLTISPQMGSAVTGLSAFGSF